MKIEILNLTLVSISKRKVVYGYRLKITDLAEEIKGYLEPLKVKDTEDIYDLSIDFISWLNLATDLKNSDVKGHKIGISNFVYSRDMIFPMLTLNEKPVLNYTDIPINDVSQNVVTMEDVNKWMTYVYQMYKTIQTNYPNNNPTGYYDTEVGLTKSVYDKDRPQVKIVSFSNYEIKEPSRAEYSEEGVINFSTVNLDTMEFNINRPFEYDINAERLQIPLNIDPPNLFLTLKLMRETAKEFGVHLSLSGIKEYYQRLVRETSAYEQEFKDMFSLEYMPSVSTRLFSTKHPHYLILDKIGENPDMYPYKKKNNISFTKPNRLLLQDKVKSNPTEYAEGAYEILFKYGRYLDMMNGPLQIGTPIFDSALEKQVPGVDYEIDHEADRLRFFTKLNLVRTGRMTTSEPNFQGMTQKIKSYISGKDDTRKILTIDIKAQEVMILIFGILENKTLKDLVLLNRDPYKSFAICAGLCNEDTFTHELKDLVKVPVLSIMNGKSRGNIIREMEGNSHVANTIMDLIVEDPGYKKIVNIAKQEQSKQSRLRNYYVIRRGLFGSKAQSRETPDLTGAFTKSLNANFQFTAAEILSYGLTCMILDLREKSNKYGLSIEQMTPLIPIYDEMVIEYDADKEKEVLDLANFYLCPQVEGWLEMSGEIRTGASYVPED